MKKNHSRAFTLVEIMVVSLLVAIVGVFVMDFFVNALRANAMTSVRLANNLAMKRTIDDLLIEARAAQRVEIYPSIDSSTQVVAGASGNYIVLYYSRVNPATCVVTPSRQVGYYLDTTDAANPRLLKHELREGAGVTAAQLSARPTVGVAPANRALVVERITNIDPVDPLRGLFFKVDSTTFRFQAAFLPKNVVPRRSANLQRNHIDLAIAIRTLR